VKASAKQKKIFDSFFLHMKKNIEVIRKRWAINLKNKDSVIDFWDSLSKADKKRLVSHPSFKHYPSCSWSRTSRKPYGEAIGHLVSKRIMLSPSDRQLLVKNAVGVFAVYAFDQAEAYEKIAMSKRLFYSTDKRVRGRSLTYAPLPMIKREMISVISRGDWSLTNKLVKRVGFINCYRLFIPDNLERLSNKRFSYNYYWWTRKALEFASRSEVKHLDDQIDSCNSDLVKSILISKMPASKMLFYMNNTSKGMRTAEVLQRKLEII